MSDSTDRNIVMTREGKKCEGGIEVLFAVCDIATGRKILWRRTKAFLQFRGLLSVSGHIFFFLKYLFNSKK